MGTLPVRPVCDGQCAEPTTKEFDMALTIDVEQESDGRWLAEVPDLPGVLTYGQTRKEAVDKAQSLALRVVADRLDHGEPGPNA
jgi:predicted RNase H-like HicB family nuclease